jgi:hypothetical protein
MLFCQRKFTAVSTRSWYKNKETRTRRTEGTELEHLKSLAMVFSLFIYELQNVDR